MRDDRHVAQLTCRANFSVTVCHIAIVMRYKNFYFSLCSAIKPLNLCLKTRLQKRVNFAVTERIHHLKVFLRSNATSIFFKLKMNVRWQFDHSKSTILFLSSMSSGCTLMASRKTAGIAHEPDRLFLVIKHYDVFHSLHPFPLWSYVGRSSTDMLAMFFF